MEGKRRKLTHPHQKPSDKRKPEILSQCTQMTPDSWKLLSKSCCFRGKVIESSHGKDTMRVGCQHIIPAGIQVRCFNQSYWEIISCSPSHPSVSQPQGSATTSLRGFGYFHVINHPKHISNGQNPEWGE